MRDCLMIGLIFLLSVLSIYGSVSLELGGFNGKAILASISSNNTTNLSIEENNTALKDLWSWGSIPVGHLINESGMLIENPMDNGFVEIPPRVSL